MATTFNEQEEFERLWQLTTDELGEIADAAVAWWEDGRKVDVTDIAYELSPEYREAYIKLSNLDQKVDGVELDLDFRKDELQIRKDAVRERTEQIGAIRTFLHDRGIWRARDLSHREAQVILSTERLENVSTNYAELKHEQLEADWQAGAVLDRVRQQAEQELHDREDRTALARQVMRERRKAREAEREPKDHDFGLER